MTDNPFPPEYPVDEAIVGLLAHQATFAADEAFFIHSTDVSSVRNPDGCSQSLTSAEMTQKQIEAAIRNLLRNGLIRPGGTLTELQAILAAGVTITGEP